MNVNQPFIYLLNKYLLSAYCVSYRIIFVKGTKETPDKINGSHCSCCWLSSTFCSWRQNNHPPKMPASLWTCYFTLQKGLGRWKGRWDGGRAWVSCLGPVSVCESLTRAFSCSWERQREMWPWMKEGSQGCNMNGFDDRGKGHKPLNVVSF